jgi:glycosyltransferase involved in cell wall biosynthesis
MKAVAVCTSTQVFGAEIATLSLLHGLKYRGHDVLAVTSSWTDGIFSRHLTNLGVCEVRMPIGVLSKRLTPQAMWWTLNALIRAPRMWRIWNSTWKKFQPDVVILTNPKQGLWLYPWMKRQPTFLIEHSLKTVSRSNRWMYRRLSRKLQGFVAVSNFIAQHLRDLAVPANQIHVIYNCLPDRNESKRKHAPDWPRDNVQVIGIVGQISPHKGHDLLLKAAVILDTRGVPFKIVVYGIGPPSYIAELDGQIESCGLSSKWRWMPYTLDRDEIYWEMDVLTVPSRCEEAFGMTAIEASSRGIPVVAARHGGLPEIIDNSRTGLLFEPHDPHDLASKLEDLLRHPDKARALGEAARTEVQLKFSEERMVTRFEALFDNLS